MEKRTLMIILLVIIIFIIGIIIGSFVFPQKDIFSSREYNDIMTNYNFCTDKLDKTEAMRLCLSNQISDNNKIDKCIEQSSWNK